MSAFVVVVLEQPRLIQDCKKTHSRKNTYCYKTTNKKNGQMIVDRKVINTKGTEILMAAEKRNITLSSRLEQILLRALEQRRLI